MKTFWDYYSLGEIGRFENLVNFHFGSYDRELYAETIIKHKITLDNICNVLQFIRTNDVKIVTKQAVFLEFISAMFDNGYTWATVAADFMTYQHSFKDKHLRV